MNYKQLYAKKNASKKKILAVCPGCPERSGIYFFLRKENGFKYAYIGQAKNLRSRLADHLQGYKQHIDLSIRRHGLYTETNPNGWEVHFLEFPESQLDEMEQKFIKDYANSGWQLRNATAGSQGIGKHGLDNNKPPKNYYDGLAQGYKNAQKFVVNLFEKHLLYEPRSNTPTKNQIKAMQKFKDFLETK